MKGFGHIIKKNDQENIMETRETGKLWITYLMGFVNGLQMKNKGGWAVVKSQKKKTEYYGLPWSSMFWKDMSHKRLMLWNNTDEKYFLMSETWSFLYRFNNILQYWFLFCKFTGWKLSLIFTEEKSILQNVIIGEVQATFPFENVAQRKKSLLS